MEGLTSKERAEPMKTRAKRLQFFVETFGGRPSYLINMGAYQILETYQSRNRAIWEYVKYAIRQKRSSMWFSLQFAPRVWWYRRVKGLNHERAVDLACAAIEEKAFPSKGAGNGAD